MLGRDGSLQRALDPGQIAELVDDGVIAGGMLPKVACAVDAIEGGVRSAHILDGRIEHAVLLEIFTSQGIGTLIEP